MLRTTINARLLNLSGVIRYMMNCIGVELGPGVPCIETRDVALLPLIHNQRSFRSPRAPHSCKRRIILVTILL